jgi:CheY-like chemotaxis protein
MVAVAEAAEVAGSPDLDTASAAELTRAWELVTKAADLSQQELVERISEQSGLPVAQLSSADPHATRLVPGELARRRNVMPLRCTDRDLIIATANPLSQDAKREVAGMASRTVRFEIAAPLEIEAAILEAYGEASDTDAVPLPSPDRVEPGGPHVLVVDDEAGARTLFRSVLEEGGFRVTLARDGPEAIGILEGDDHVDLITLDYWMDKMNGLRVLQQIRSQPDSRKLPVIMVTGAKDRRIEMSLFEAGADDFVVKPVDGPLFVLRVQAVLRRRLLT